jgi:hypothetical protein
MDHSLAQSMVNWGGFKEVVGEDLTRSRLLGTFRCVPFGFSAWSCSRCSSRNLDSSLLCEIYIFYIFLSESIFANDSLNWLRRTESFRNGYRLTAANVNYIPPCLRTPSLNMVRRSNGLAGRSNIWSRCEGARIPPKASGPIWQQHRSLRTAGRTSDQTQGQQG